MESYLAPLPDNARYGIHLSGGLDSALLFYGLAIYKPNSSFLLVTGSRLDDGSYNLPYAKKVADFIVATTNADILEHVTPVFADRSEGRSQRGQIVNLLTYDFQLDCWAGGKTANPPIDLGDGRDESRDGTNRDISRSLQYEIDYYSPFTNVDKRQIAEWYKEYNLMDSLYPLTMSCEAPTPPRPCGACWWCKEKEWAFGNF